MSPLSSVFAALANEAPKALNEDLFRKKTVNVQACYLPGEETLRLESTPDLDRLHILLRGKCRLTQGANQLMVEEGHALGIGAPGKHELRAEPGGMAYLTLAIRRAEEGVSTASGGLSIMNLLGADRTTARDRLEDWSQRPNVGGRVSLIPLEQLPPGPLKIYPASERLFLVLEGTLRLETPVGTRTIPGPSFYSLPPDTPHRLLSAAHGRTTVLSISDQESADQVVTYLSCGHRARWCDLVHYAGDGMIYLDSTRKILHLNQVAKSLLGLSEQEPASSDLADLLLPRDAQWLASKLKTPGPSHPLKTIWAAPKTEDLSMSVLLVPYQGERRMSTALVYLKAFPSPSAVPAISLSQRAIPSPGISPLTTPSSLAPARDSSPRASADTMAPVNPIVLSSRMKELKSIVEGLPAEDSWIVFWGEKGAGRSTFAKFAHSVHRGDEPSFRVLDCSSREPASIPGLLFQNHHTNQIITCGPWLKDLNLGTLFLESFECLPIALQNRILKQLTELKGTSSLPFRILIEMDRRPQKGLPCQATGTGAPKRGAFTVVEIPPLRERREDIPLLFRSFLQRHLQPEKPLPRISGEAMELLLSHSYPRNLHDLHCIAQALTASPVEGVIPSATLRPLLGPKHGSSLFDDEEDIPTLATLERSLVLRALRRTGGNKAKAARVLGITRTRLYRMVAEHQISL